MGKAGALQIEQDIPGTKLYLSWSGPSLKGLHITSLQSEIGFLRLEYKGGFFGSRVGKLTVAEPELTSLSLELPSRPTDGSLYTRFTVGQGQVSLSYLLVVRLLDELIEAKDFLCRIAWSLFTQPQNFDAYRSSSSPRWQYLVTTQLEGEFSTKITLQHEPAPNAEKILELAARVGY
jgi:hypothetical protein